MIEWQWWIFRFVIFVPSTISMVDLTANPVDPPLLVPSRPFGSCGTNNDPNWVIIGLAMMPSEKESIIDYWLFSHCVHHHHRESTNPNDNRIVCSAGSPITIRWRLSSFYVNDDNIRIRSERIVHYHHHHYHSLLIIPAIMWDWIQSSWPSNPSHVVTIMYH